VILTTPFFLSYSNGIEVSLSKTSCVAYLVRKDSDKDAIHYRYIIVSINETKECKDIHRKKVDEVSFHPLDSLFELHALCPYFLWT
jgi:hypothetical protein